MKHCKIVIGLVWLSILVFGHVAPVDAASLQQVSMLKPSVSPTKARHLKPGLRVEYIPGFVRHIDEIASKGNGHDGGILATLDWHNADGKVMTSGLKDGVVAKITGFINFASAGDYVLTIQSNDGVRLTIGGKLIIDDPEVHPERFSPNVTVQIETPGWYPLRLLYFERRGSSTMELYWQPPGVSGFDFVPASAFAHQSAGE